MRKLSLLIVIITFAACQKKETLAKKEIVKDPHTFSNPADAVAKHLDLDIKVDFNTQTISGKASWQIENTSKGNEIIFDENTLNITKVTLGDDEKETKFELGNEVKFHGKPLHITIDANTDRKSVV